MNLPVYFEIFVELPKGGYVIVEQGRSTQNQVKEMRPYVEQLCEKHQASVALAASILH